MRKRGFGVNKWNGFGGKVVDGEKIEEAAVREVFEEINVKVKDLEKVGEIEFYFPHKQEWNQTVHVFIAKNWEGKIKETEEMKPKWFSINSIPYDEMWVDDRYWLPQVLEGKRVKARFVFGEDNNSLLEVNLLFNKA
jgi:8-oxo-dGTP diphosphatase